MLFSGLGASSSAPPVALMMFNSLIMALAIALGKIAISIIAAFAIVYFKFPFRMTFFWMIFITLMLPVEVRILPTYEVVANLGLLNSYAGLTIPLIASATATFLFRQFFLSVPDELTEAARIDGAGPLRFFRDVLLPLSRTSIAALFVIQFIYGWNQYLWPLLVTTERGLLHRRHGHLPHGQCRRCRGEVEPDHGGDPAGDDPAGDRRGFHAAAVRQRFGRDREIAGNVSAQWQASACEASASRLTAWRSFTASIARSRTASSS